jgi:hypothetical protein
MGDVISTNLFPAGGFLQFNKQVLIKMCLKTGAPEVRKVCSVKNYRNTFCPRGAKQNAILIKRQNNFVG